MTITARKQAQLDNKKRDFEIHEQFRLNRADDIERPVPRSVQFGTILALQNADREPTAVQNTTEWKSSVRVATTSNITLSGTQTIDGVSVVTNDRVLVKDQRTGAHNGIWIAKSGAWTRAEDADSDAELLHFACFVREGDTHDNQAFICTNNTITIGNTALTIVQFGSGGSTSLSALSDTEFVRLVNNQFLYYDSATRKWKNKLLGETDIPNLPASKITSGTFATSMIPSMMASKIDSGVFNRDRIPSITEDKLAQAVRTKLNAVGDARLENLKYGGDADANKIFTAAVSPNPARIAWPLGAEHVGLGWLKFNTQLNSRIGGFQALRAQIVDEDTNNFKNVIETVMNVEVEDQKAMAVSSVKNSINAVPYNSVTEIFGKKKPLLKLVDTHFYPLSASARLTPIDIGSIYFDAQVRRAVGRDNVYDQITLAEIKARATSGRLTYTAWDVNHTYVRGDRISYNNRNYLALRTVQGSEGTPTRLGRTVWREFTSNALDRGSVEIVLRDVNNNGRGTYSTDTFKVPMSFSIDIGNIMDVPLTITEGNFASLNGDVILAAGNNKRVWLGGNVQCFKKFRLGSDSDTKANGDMWLDGNDIKVRTGGGTKSLSDIGTGSSSGGDDDGDTPSTPVPNNVLRIVKSGTPTTIGVSTLDTMFGKEKGAIGCYADTVTSNRDATKIVVWIRNDDFWGGVQMTEIGANGNNLVGTAYGTSTEKRRILYAGNRNARPSSSSVGSSTTGTIFTLEETDDVTGDGAFGVMVGTSPKYVDYNDTNVITSLTSVSALSTTTQTLIDTVPTVNISTINLSGLDSAFGTAEGSIGFNQGTNHLFIKINGRWWRRHLNRS